MIIYFNVMVILVVFYIGLIIQYQYYQADNIFCAGRTKIGINIKFLLTFPVPKSMNEEELKQSVSEFENAAVLALKAGFDGVELHGANGYLLEQFLSPISNHRTDK